MLSGGFRFALPTLRSAMTTKKKGSGTPTDVCIEPPRLSGAARTSGCARLSAFHRGSYRQGFRPLGATPGQASWDVAGRSIRYGRPNRGAKTLRSYTGVTRARLSQSRERTSQTGHSAGRMMPKAAPARIANPRGSTALAPCSGLPREHFLDERDSLIVYLK